MTLVPLDVIDMRQGAGQRVAEDRDDSGPALQPQREESTQMARDDPGPFGQLVGPVDKIVPEEGGTGGGFRAPHPQEGVVETPPRCLRDMEEVDKIALDRALHR